MKKQKKVKLILVKSLLIFSYALSGLLSCDGVSGSEKSNSNRLKGKVLYKGSPVASAKVSLDNSLSQEAFTDSNGVFELENVISGINFLKVEKELPNGQVIYKIDSLTIDSDLLNLSLALPEPPLLQITSDSSKFVSISWSKFEDTTQFQEYKLFGKEDGGIDETHGKLIHVSLNISDTVFKDEFNPVGGQFFYRVYVMNNYGKIGGSNIAIHDVPFNMAYTLPNYSFEKNGSGWFLYNAYETPIWKNFVDEEHYWLANIDSSQAFEGEKSLRLTFGKGRSLIYDGQYTKSTSKLNGLSSGTTYLASFMMQYASCKESELQIWLEVNNVKHWIGKVSTEGTDKNWQKIQTELTLGPDIDNFPAHLKINFGRFGNSAYELQEHLGDTVWVDNILIRKKK